MTLCLSMMETHTTARNWPVSVEILCPSPSWPNLDMYVEFLGFFVCDNLSISYKKDILHTN